MMPDTNPILPHDVQTVSFPKMGRTLLCRLYVLYCCKAAERSAALPRKAFAKLVRKASSVNRPDESEQFANLLEETERKGLLLPRIRGFRHSDPQAWRAKYVLKTWASERHVFIVRDPRDTVVSYFHHCQSYKKPLKLPPPEATLPAFIHSRIFGIPSVCWYLNSIARLHRKRAEDIHIIFFEEMLRDKETVLRRLLEFVGAPSINDEAIAFAVQESDFDKCRVAELTRRRGESGPEWNPNALRHRKGKVGGYKKELSAEDIAWIERYMGWHLAPMFLERYSVSGTIPKVRLAMASISDHLGLRRQHRRAAEPPGQPGFQEKAT